MKTYETASRTLTNKIDRNVRSIACLVYAVMGGVILIVLVAMTVYLKFSWEKLYSLMTSLDLKKEYWCLGWSAIGISLGLWNDRENLRGRTKKLQHYLTYFVFVWFIASLVAFISNSPHFYLSSALIALVIGFTGDSLAGIISKLTKL